MWPSVCCAYRVVEERYSTRGTWQGKSVSWRGFWNVMEAKQIARPNCLTRNTVTNIDRKSTAQPRKTRPQTNRKASNTCTSHPLTTTKIFTKEPPEWLTYTRTKRIVQQHSFMTNKAAAQLGRKGGKARLTSMTPEQRREVARKAGLASGKKRAEEAAKKKKDDHA